MYLTISLAIYHSNRGVGPHKAHTPYLPHTYHIQENGWAIAIMWICIEIKATPWTIGEHRHKPYLKSDFAWAQAHQTTTLNSCLPNIRLQFGISTLFLCFRVKKPKSVSDEFQSMLNDLFGKC